jgi:hypothetical protein
MLLEEAATAAAAALSSGLHTICDSTSCSGWGRSPMFTSILTWQKERQVEVTERRKYRYYSINSHLS